MSNSKSKNQKAKNKRQRKNKNEKGLILKNQILLNPKKCHVCLQNIAYSDLKDGLYIDENATGLKCKNCFQKEYTEYKHKFDNMKFFPICKKVRKNLILKKKAEREAKLKIASQEKKLKAKKDFFKRKHEMTLSQIVHFYAKETFGMKPKKGKPPGIFGGKFNPFSVYYYEYIVSRYTREELLAKLP